MEKGRTRRHGATDEGCEHPPLAVVGPEGRVRERHSVDRDRATDDDVRPAECRDLFDQRPPPAGAEAETQVAASPCLLEWRRSRQADEEPIADPRRTIERHDPPEAKRFTRRRVEAEPEDGSGEHRGRDRDRHGGEKRHDAPAIPHWSHTPRIRV